MTAKKKKIRRSSKRRRVFGTAARPRLCVFRSLKNISSQLVDDDRAVTLVSAGTLEKEYRDRHGKKGSGREAAMNVGKLMAEKALPLGIERVVFDRRDYRYHGRVRALAEGAREGGLKF